METDDNYVKILFRFYSETLEEVTVETMWAEIMDEDAGIYQLNSIPFYAPDLAAGDVISAAYDEVEQMLIYQETVSYSGNSTIQVIIFDESVIPNDIMVLFQQLGCSTEQFKGNYFVIDVPAEVVYSPIRAKLTELSEAGIIDYAEPCLSAQHGNAE